MLTIVHCASIVHLVVVVLHTHFLALFHNRHSHCHFYYSVGVFITFNYIVIEAFRNGVDGSMRVNEAPVCNCKTRKMPIILQRVWVLLSVVHRDRDRDRCDVECKNEWRRWMYVARMTNSQLNCYLFICMQSKTEPIELRIVLNEMKYLYRLGE